MSDLFDHFSDDATAGSHDLEYVRVGAAPAFVLPFTTETEEARTHYVDDQEARGYTNCPGQGRCPLCHVGDPATTFLLLPVYCVDTGAVAVLHMSKAIGPGALGPALRRALASNAAAEKLLLISRRGNRYTVEARPLSDDVDRGSAEIKAFIQAREAGLRLSSAFATAAPEDLAALPRVRRKLDAMGGFHAKGEEVGSDAPGADASPES